MIHIIDGQGKKRIIELLSLWGEHICLCIRQQNSMAIYTSEELRAVQLIELEALKEVVRICDKLSIECFLVGGSCLGAMRHGGPWGDDLDEG